MGENEWGERLSDYDARPQFNPGMLPSFLASFFPSLPPDWFPITTVIWCYELVARRVIPYVLGRVKRKKREGAVPSVKEWRKGKVATAIDGGQSVLKTSRN